MKNVGISENGRFAGGHEEPLCNHVCDTGEVDESPGRGQPVPSSAAGSESCHYDDSGANGSRAGNIAPMPPNPLSAVLDYSYQFNFCLRCMCSQFCRVVGYFPC